MPHLYTNLRPVSTLIKLIIQYLINKKLNICYNLLKYMSKSVFDFNKYIPYLEVVLDSKGKHRGRKTAAAVAMQIQPAYLSLILKGQADLNLEQAHALSTYLMHNEDESHFLLLLVQKDRAGTKSLRAYFQKQIDQVLKNRLILTERLGISDSLSEDEKQKYYSSWIYSAIHIAVTIPELQNKKSLCHFLNLKTEPFLKALNFLMTAGLVEQRGDILTTGRSIIRLGNNSYNIIKHHTNWRNQAIESLEREDLSDLHYSAVVSVSKKDVLVIKNQILDYIKNLVEVIKASKEESLCTLNIDFFNLDKKID